MLDIKVLGSQCAVSDYYREVVEKTAQELGLDYTIEKIEAEDILRQKYNVYVGCLIGYCPGCNHAPRDSASDRYTPALVLNGRLVLHSRFPDESEFRKLLIEFA